MELFQSSLLKYWEFEPNLGEEEVKLDEAEHAEEAQKQPKERKVQLEEEVLEPPLKPGEKRMRKRKPPPKKVR